MTSITRKASLADIMRIQTLRERPIGAKAFMAAYADKGWMFSTVKKICQHVDRTGLATEHKAGCDWCCSFNIFERWQIGRSSR